MFKNKLSHRSDIDGLRTLAVLSVLIFHAFPNFLPGGFVGVDVFFVISGYLISRILIHNMEQGSFSFLDFWSRRVKRILPPLFIVLLATTLVGWIIYLPSEFSMLCKHVIAGTFFVSNILLSKEIGYFDVASDYKPLLHLWSLGIEEQFYLVWPLLLFLFKRKKKVLLVIGLSSFCYGLFLTLNKPQIAFFIPQTRIWELMIGALIANFEINPNSYSDKIQKKLGKYFKDIGLIAISTSILLFDKSYSFPGTAALLPTLGTALVIFGVSNSRLTSFLSYSKITYIGKLSYPLYLWHWPIIVYAKVLDFVSTGSLVICLSISFILSILTSKYLEAPSINLSFRRSWEVLISFFIFGGVMIFIFKSHPYTYFSNEEIVKIDIAKNDWEFPGSFGSKVPDKKNFVKIGDSKVDESIIFWGDSNIQQFAPILNIAFIKSKIVSLFITKGGCPPLEGFYRNDGVWCDDIYQNALNYILNSKVEKVVIGGFWYGYLTEPQHYILRETKKEFLIRNGMSAVLENLTITIQNLKKANKKIYVVLHIPIADKFDPNKMINRSHFGKDFFSTNLGPLKLSEVHPLVLEINNELIEWSRDQGIHLLDPFSEICKDSLCLTNTSNGPIYKDLAHLRPYFVKEMSFLNEVLFN